MMMLLKNLRNVVDQLQELQIDYFVVFVTLFKLKIKMK